MPVLSIIIPTYNRAAVLQQSILGVLEQSFVDWEMLVIDQSDAEDREINERFLRGLDDRRIRYVHLSVKGTPNARNEGVKRSRGAIVLYLDDDVILLRDGFLEAHVRAYGDPSVGGVTGRTVERVIVPNTQRTMCRVAWNGRVISNLAGCERVRLDTLKGANMSFRASVFQTVGGFDRNYVGTSLLEEADFSTRVAAAGWTLLFEPDAELLHLSSPSGGLRKKDPNVELYWRVCLTTYFMLVHRGVISMPPFLATFSVIVLERALRWRSLGPVRALVPAVALGIEMWRNGSDRTLAESRRGTGEPAYEN